MKATLLAMLKRHEGLRLKAYKDTVGVWTIGYGHTGPGVKEGMEITPAYASYLLEMDIGMAELDARDLPWFEDLNDARKIVILNMLFNLGKKRFRGFRKFIAALERKDYIAASEEMMESKWAKQVRSKWVSVPRNFLG
jgi:lysozyme